MRHKMNDGHDEEEKAHLFHQRREKKMVYFSGYHITGSSSFCLTLAIYICTIYNFLERKLE